MARPAIPPGTALPLLALQPLRTASLQVCGKMTTESTIAISTPLTMPVTRLMPTIKGSAEVKVAVPVTAVTCSHMHKHGKCTSSANTQYKLYCRRLAVTEQNRVIVAQTCQCVDRAAKKVLVTACMHACILTRVGHIPFRLPSHAMQHTAYMQPPHASPTCLGTTRYQPQPSVHGRRAG